MSSGSLTKGHTSLVKQLETTSVCGVNKDICLRIDKCVGGRGENDVFKSFKVSYVEEE